MTIENCFGFWDSNNLLDKVQLQQIMLWAKSIIFFNPSVNIFLYTKKNIIPPKLLEIDKLNIIYEDNFSNLFIDTPLEGIIITESLSKPELSDIIRLSLLYKYGGTWIDIDDITIRKFPSKKDFQSAIKSTYIDTNNKSLFFKSYNFFFISIFFVISLTIIFTFNRSHKSEKFLEAEKTAHV